MVSSGSKQEIFEGKMLVAQQPDSPKQVEVVGLKIVRGWVRGGFVIPKGLPPEQPFQVILIFF